MVDEVKQAVEGLMTSFEEFKKANDTRLAEIEKRGAADVVTSEKVDRIEKSLASLEDINQKLTKAQLDAKAAQDATKELKEQGERLELKMNRPGAGGRERQVELKQQVNLWARGVVGAFQLGMQNLPPEQQKALHDATAEYKSMSVTDDTTGGYLAPKEFVAEIIKGVTELSPVRSLVRVRPTSQKAIQVPKRTGQFAAQRVTEQGTRSETTGLTYGMVEITAPELFALIDISQQNLEDSEFDLEAEISSEATEQFAVKEGAEFVSGTGIGQCEGILTNASVASVNSGSATTVADVDGQANGILSLFYGIKTAYAQNATWTLNRTTLGSVRKLKDAQKQYVWMPGLAQGQPNTINGAPYVEVPDMPNEGAGLYPIAFGDFRRAYTLVDRIAMSMLRDPFTQATSGNIRFLFRRRTGGAVVLAEAIQKLKCSA